MEQHPIPRNISSFQFRLIGDMTLQQFGYLAAGVFFAYVAIRAIPLPAIFVYPFAAIIGFLGFAFAFIPVQERPLDRWLAAFLKSIYSPTQYLWRKDGFIPDVLLSPSFVHIQTVPAQQREAHTNAQEKLHAYLKTIPQTPHQTLNEKEKRYLDATLTLFNTSSQSVTLQPITHAGMFHPTTTPNQTSSLPFRAPPTAPKEEIPHEKTPETPDSTHVHSAAPSVPPSPATTHAPVSMSPREEPQISLKPIASVIRAAPETVTQENSTIQTPQILHSHEDTPLPPLPMKETNVPIQTPAPVQSAPPPKEEPLTSHSDVELLKKQLSELASQKDTLIKQIDSLKKTADTKQSQTQQEVIKPGPQKESTKEPTITTIAAKAAMNEVGLPRLPQTPNIVIGVIKDMQKRLLPNIIITIKDMKGVPLRALKTNKIGQFTVATPLPNGTFLLETEDPMKRYVFDIAQITLDGSIFLPIEITAKGEKELMREKLSKELFGNS